jgi:peptidyl-tRNA hydrolase, PTH1 family
VEAVAAEEGIRIRARECSSRVGRGRIGEESVLLALPQTYMNASGEAVSALCKKHSVEPSELCVVVDDIDLPLGTLRLRARGSAGGQKGLRSVIAHLGTPEFPRLRVGIRGERYSRQRDLADYVLEPFAKAERKQYEDSVGRAAEAVRLWVTHGIDAAMRRANVLPSSPDRLDPD